MTEALPNCQIVGFHCYHLAACSTTSCTICILVRGIETVCEAKRPLRNFILNTTFHSVDSIFCLITAFPFFLFICFKMKHAHEKFNAVICICRFPWLGCRLLFWENGMKVISGSAEWISIFSSEQMHSISTVPAREVIRGRPACYLNPSIHSGKHKEGPGDEYLKNSNSQLLTPEPKHRHVCRGFL